MTNLNAIHFRLAVTLIACLFLVVMGFGCPTSQGKGCTPGDPETGSDEGSGKYGGLKSQEFMAIFALYHHELGKIYVGINTSQADTSGKVIMDKSGEIPYHGTISTDDSNRWLTMDWAGTMARCNGEAKFHARVWWASVEALTGDALVTVTCRDSEPIKYNVTDVRLLYDPDYVK